MKQTDYAPVTNVVYATPAEPVDPIRLRALELAVEYCQQPGLTLKNGENSTVLIARTFESYLRKG